MTLALPVAGLVLLAALMHASWNALLKSAGDGVLAYAVFCGAVGVVGSLMLLIVPFPAPASWPYVVVSTVIHLGYFAGLTAAYRVGDLSQIYPLARGASPLFVTLGAFLFAAEVPSGREAAGILIASLGIASLAFAGTRPIRADPRPVLYALATALTIGAYTVVDGIGVRRSDSAAGYAALYFVLIAISVVGATTVLRGPGPLLAFARRYRLRGGVGGILLAGSYGFVLWALSFSAMAPIAALRETSVIFAALMGTFLLGEGFGWRRIVSAVVVAAGLVLLNTA